MKHLLSITDLDKKELTSLIDFATQIKANPALYQDKLSDKIIATLFFEPSTRTRLSFESAALRVGAKLIGFADASTSSTQKGETLEDTIKIVSGLADLIVMRHPASGAAKRAAAVSKVPVINAGDGSGEHPNQAMLDIFTIKENKKTLENLNIAFVGDLKNGRTVHSLSLGMAHFNPNYYFISPPSLAVPAEIKQALNLNKIKFSELTDWQKIAPQIDVLYMTRVQKERFNDVAEYESVKDAYILNANSARLFKSTCIFMHPLPRVTEISAEVDADPRAIYFDQARNGLWLRMALLISMKY